MHSKNDKFSKYKKKSKIYFLKKNNTISNYLKIYSICYIKKVFSLVRLETINSSYYKIFSFYSQCMNV